MIPACLFGIPAAPFAAMVMAICMYFGMEIGTPDLLQDINFTNSLAFGYIFGTIGVAVLSIFCYKYILKILEVPFWIYAAFILVVIVWANMQYTGGWEDFALLAILCLLTLLQEECAKRFDGQGTSGFQHVEILKLRFDNTH